MLEEEEEEKLRVVRQDEGFYLDKRYNTASCLFKKEIYAFQTDEYDKVNRYNVETGKWSLYHSR